MADEYMTQLQAMLAQRAAGGDAAMDPTAPPGAPPAMAWNMVAGAPAGGGGPLMSSAGPLVSQAPPPAPAPPPMVAAPVSREPLVSQAPPADALVSQAPPPPPAPPPPEEKRVPVSAGLAPDRFSLKALIAAKEEADKIPIYGPVDPGPGLRAAPRPDPNAESSVSLSAQPFNYIGVQTAGRGAREIDTMGPKAKGLVNAAYDARGEGADQAMAEKLRDGAEREAYFGAKANELADQAEAMQRVQAERAAELDRLHGEMKADADQVAQQRIDFGKGIGDTNLNLLAIALGGFMMRRNGGRNVGLEMVNQKIDQSVAAQKFAHDAGLKGFDAKQSAYKMALEKYGNEDAARQMARVYMLDKYAADADRIASASNDADVKARNAEFQATVQSERDMTFAKALQFVQASGGGRIFIDPRTGLRYTENELKHKVDAQEMKTLETGLDMTKEGYKAKAEAGKKAGDTFVSTGPDGQGYNARDVAQAKEADERHQMAAKTLDLLNQAEELRRGATKTDLASVKAGFPTERMKKLAALNQQAILTNSKAMGAGTLDKGNQEVQMGILGDWTGVKDPTPNIQILKDRLQRETNIADAGNNKTIPKVPQHKAGWDK